MLYPSLQSLQYVMGNSVKCWAEQNQPCGSSAAYVYVYVIEHFDEGSVSGSHRNLLKDVKAAVCFKESCG